MTHCPDNETRIIEISQQVLALVRQHAQDEHEVLAVIEVAKTIASSSFAASLARGLQVAEAPA